MQRDQFRRYNRALARIPTAIAVLPTYNKAALAVLRKEV
jgi:hypothetical protein